jgi:hypothetical protein
MSKCAGSANVAPIVYPPPPEPHSQSDSEPARAEHRACARRPRQCDRGVRSNHGEEMAATLSIRLCGYDDMARSAISAALSHATGRWDAVAITVRTNEGGAR